MKKIILVIVLLAILIPGGLLLWRYINYTRDPDPYKSFLYPRMGMSIIEITSLTAEKMDANVHVLVKNTLPFSFTADSFQYRLFINDAEVMKSRYKKSITLLGNDSSWIKMPVTIYSRDLDSVINANERRKIDSAEYRMKASFNTDLFFKKHFDVTIKRYLPLIHIPDLKIENIDIDSLNLKRAAIIVHAAVRNDNVFDIKVKNYSYEFQIEDHEWVKGVMNKHTIIRKKSTSDVLLPITLSFKEVGKTLFKLLRKGSDVKYKMVMNLVIDSENNMIKDSKAIIKSQGSVKSILKATKGKS